MGGLVAGALLGLALSRPWTIEQSARLRTRRFAALGPAGGRAPGAGSCIPAPSYRLGEELRAREAISHFLEQDQRISQQWESILGKGQSEQLSFDQMAGQIDDSVTAEYQESFEQLSALHLDAAAPSAQTLEILRKYAVLRTNASHALSEGLRNRDRRRSVRRWRRRGRRRRWHKRPRHQCIPPSVPASAPRP